jgi:2,6-dihydroxypseudooxynicotine hydrolase
VLGCGQWEHSARLVKEASGPAELLLLLEAGNHGCANLVPFHRYRTADWVAEQVGGNPA